MTAAGRSRYLHSPLFTLKKGGFSVTTRDQIHKWFFYALGLFPVWVLDAFVLNRIAPFGVIPMLLPLAVVSVAVLEGAYAGAGFGLAVGLLWELSYPGGFGGLVFGMTLAGMVLDGLQILRALFIQLDTLDVLLQVAVPEVLLSLCWTPVVYLIFRLIYRRVGGTRLA